jgi:hypothetical protein
MPDQTVEHPYMQSQVMLWSSFVGISEQVLT